MKKSEIEKLLKEEEAAELKLSKKYRVLNFSARLNYFYKELMDYYSKNGHFMISARENRRLNRFIPKIHQTYVRWKFNLRYRQKSKDIDSSVIKIFHDLEERDFFSLKYTSPWDKSYASLKLFYKKNNHSLIKTKIDKSDTEADISSNWVAQQRFAKKQQLSDERIHKLNNINFFDYNI